MNIDRSLRPAIRFLAAIALLLGGLLVSGCRQDMHDQHKIEPFEASTFYPDGAASRLPVEGTIARGQLKEDTAFHTGMDAEGKPLAALPMDWDRDLLERGWRRYDIYCAPCHGSTGEGDGMIVQRGFKRPTSFHDDRLRQSEVGYFYDVITRGFGQMPSYASQMPPEDRWAVAAFVRVLQRSQRVALSDLASQERQSLLDAIAAGEAHGAEPAGHGAGEGSHE